MVVPSFYIVKLLHTPKIGSRASVRPALGHTTPQNGDNPQAHISNHNHEYNMMVMKVDILEKMKTNETQQDGIALDIPF